MSERAAKLIFEPSSECLYRMGSAFPCNHTDPDVCNAGLGLCARGPERTCPCKACHSAPKTEHPDVLLDRAHEAARTARVARGEAFDALAEGDLEKASDDVAVATASAKEAIDAAVTLYSDAGITATRFASFFDAAEEAAEAMGHANVAARALADGLNTLQAGRLKASRRPLWRRALDRFARLLR